MSSEEKRQPPRSRYRKVHVRLWGDRAFRALSKAPPNGQTLFVYLLTTPSTKAFPGLFCAGQFQLAEELDWPIQGLRKAWAEIEREGLAVADWEARVIWLPSAMVYNEPESPNVVSAWRAACEEIPECDLRTTAMLAAEEYLTGLGPAWIAAWQLSDRRDGSKKPARIHRDVCAEVRKRDGGMCRYCGCKVNWSDRKSASGGTFDHVDPSGPGSPENVVTACRGCNSRKGFRTPEMAGMPVLDLTTEPPVAPSTNASDADQASINGSSRDRIYNQEQDQEQDQEQEGNARVRANPLTPDLGSPKRTADPVVVDLDGDEELLPVPPLPCWRLWAIWELEVGGGPDTCGDRKPHRRGLTQAWASCEKRAPRDPEGLWATMVRLYVADRRERGAKLDLGFLCGAEFATWADRASGRGGPRESKPLHLQELP